MSDEARLLDVASAVAEGRDVDWNDLERRSIDAKELLVVRSLRLLASVSKVAGNASPVTVEEARSRSAAGEAESWGHLRRLSRLGEGAFGRVYRAWDPKLEREVALKLAPVSGEGVEPRRALREARLLARIRHPNVVMVYGADCHDDRFGIWMEIIDGLTLEELLFAHGPMSAGEATLVGIDLCHALAAVHNAGLLHGDVKATNVMRAEGGRIVLMDFGAGRHIPAADDIPESVAGTLLYIAPELLFGGKASVSADVYSLGVLLYYLATGKYPVIGENIADIRLAHQWNRRTSLRDARPDLQPGFVDVVERALSPDPKARYRTVGVLGQALADQAGVPYPPDPRPIPYWKTVAVTAAGVAVLFGVAEVVRFSSRSTSTASEVASPASRAATSIGPLSTGSGAFDVSAAFYASRSGGNVRLAAGDRVRPGDRLFFEIQSSRPVYVYIVNQDEKGESYLLFPLEGYEPANPIPPARTHRLPGSRNAADQNWMVTSAGGREHFFVYVTPSRLTEFEQILAALPRVTADRPVDNIPLSEQAMTVFRGVGGITSSTKPATPDSGLAELPILSESSQTANSLWARQITFTNPATP